MKFVRLFTAIVIGGLAFGQSAFADDSFTPEQKQQMGSVIHDYLMANPEVIAEAVQKLQQKQMDSMRSKGQQTALKNANELFSSTGDPVAGNPNGKVTLVEFFDYQCPHCVEMDPDLQALIKANPDLRVVFKEFPIRGPLSVYTAKASLAAAKQGKYEQFHAALMKSAQSLSEAKVLELAKSVGLDVAKLKTDMNSPAIDSAIKANYKLAQALELYGTPAIYIVQTNVPKDAKNIEFIPGQVDQKYMQTSVDKVKAE